jgi:hypothetical protein
VFDVMGYSLRTFNIGNCNGIALLSSGYLVVSRTSSVQFCKSDDGSPAWSWQVKGFDENECDAKSIVARQVPNETSGKRIAGHSQFAPKGVFVDAQDHIYVCDSMTKRVLMFAV